MPARIPETRRLDAIDGGAEPGEVPTARGAGQQAGPVENANAVEHPAPVAVRCVTSQRFPRRSGRVGAIVVGLNREFPMSDEVEKAPQPVYVVSDGTGDTAEKMVRAAFRQFRGHVVHLRTFPHVTSPDQLTLLIRRAQAYNALVVTTLVRADMRDLARRLAQDAGVRHIDLIGELLTELQVFLNEAPVGVPGLLRQADEQYFRRIEAIEFTVKADDGKETRMLREADIVLVGVSRTSKTPLSTFLAHKGFKVGNVPIVLDQPPPPDLFKIDQRRIFALIIEPVSLQNIRKVRLRAMGMPAGTNYGDIDYIQAELEYATTLYRTNPTWPVIDVTNKAVEETTATILGIYYDRGFGGPVGDVSQL
jgi:regulator of PEP synthase PpsR (kinase-PPPase family)